MADSFLLKEDAFYLLLEDGGKIILEESIDTVGGSSGGKVKKRIGHQLTDLGPRPYITQQGESIASVILRPLNRSKSKLTIKVSVESVQHPIIPPFDGISVCLITLPVRSESTARLHMKLNGKSWGVTHPSIMMEHVIKSNDKYSKTVKALIHLNMLNSIDEMHKTDGND